MSPHCTNECGRKMPEELKEEARKSGLPICWSYFCGEPEPEDLKKKD